MNESPPKTTVKKTTVKKTTVKKTTVKKTTVKKTTARKTSSATIPVSADVEYTYTLKIPKDRIAVVIGKAGEKKTEFQKELGVRMQIDSKEGEVVITGKDSLKVYMLHEVVRAIARGFNPETASLLLKQDYMLEIVNIMDYSKKKNHVPRLRGRVIGTKGKSRATIEELTQTHVCVYGKTIGIIGDSGSVTIAKRAIESLLGGSTHATVYKFLEKSRKEMKRREMIGY
ncbi:MAG: KH domain-containing protein [Nanoarchaeota archaeon]|nr:KH domain-containing protein [Nanoarchaeota archaeon]